MQANSDHSAAEEPEKDLRRPFWQRMTDAFFGYDFFISYAHMDGSAYARGLAQRLEDYGFECFFDTDDYETGDDWKKVGAWALRRTTRLVLIGSPNALQSPAVLREVQIFTASGKRIIPIDFGGSLSQIEKGRTCSALLGLIPAEVLQIKEETRLLGQGPSDDAVKKIARTFQATRQSVKRRRWLQGLAVVLLALLVWAGVEWSIAQKERNEANRQLSEVSWRLARRREAAISLLLPNQRSKRLIIY